MGEEETRKLPIFDACVVEGSLLLTGVDQTGFPDLSKFIPAMGVGTPT
jgi:hypothetical protein